MARIHWDAAALMASKGITNLLILLLVVVLSWSLPHHVVEGVSSILSEKEDLELERQLKILNKPPVKTIHTEWGDIHDCIDIHKQPAFDHPLLQNHKIQMNPSFVRDEINSSITRPDLEGCPKGTVPIRRTQKEDLIRAKSLLSSFKIVEDGFAANVPNQEYNVGLTYHSEGETFFGAAAITNIYNPQVTNDQFSSSEITLRSGDDDSYNQIKFGWTVNPQLYGGDKRTRNFVYWTSDGGRKTGCYNTLCPGFVQVHPTVTPTVPLTVVSTYEGTQYVAEYMVAQDAATKNWWLIYEKNIKVGYWPNELFPLFNTLGAEYIYWGGHVKAGEDGTSPPMGSGHCPDGIYKHSGYFYEIQYQSKSGELLNPEFKKMECNTPCKDFYGLMYFGFRKPEEGHTFLFGGPGGKCT